MSYNGVGNWAKACDEFAKKLLLSAYDLDAYGFFNEVTVVQGNFAVDSLKTLDTTTNIRKPFKIYIGNQAKPSANNTRLTDQRRSGRRLCL